MKIPNKTLNQKNDKKATFEQRCSVPIRESISPNVKKKQNTSRFDPPSDLQFEYIQDFETVKRGKKTLKQRLY